MKTMNGGHAPSSSPIGPDAPYCFVYANYPHRSRRDKCGEVRCRPTFALRVDGVVANNSIKIIIIMIYYDYYGNASMI